MKPIIYVGNAQKELARFPDKAKKRILTALTFVSTGAPLSPKEFKSMSTIGQGVYELRIKVSQQYRIFYVAKFTEAIYVLHAFVKKTQQTARKDVELGATRYKMTVQMRKRK